MSDTPASRNQHTNIATSEGPRNIDLAAGGRENPGSDVGHGLKLWADVGLELGTKVDKLGNGLQKLANKLQENTPVDYQVQAQGQFVTGVPLVLNLGSPDQGTFWEIMQVAVGGNDYTVAATGSFGLYVAAVPQVSACNLLNLEWFSNTLPFVDTWGTRQIIANDNEYLLAVINGGTNGQSYVARSSVTVWRAEAQRGNSVDVA